MIVPHFSCQFSFNVSPKVFMLVSQLSCQSHNYHVVSHRFNVSPTVFMLVPQFSCQSNSFYVSSRVLLLVPQFPCYSFIFHKSPTVFFSTFTGFMVVRRFILIPHSSQANSFHVNCLTVFILVPQNSCSPKEFMLVPNKSCQS